jgi:hypothetical protein
MWMAVTLCGWGTLASGWMGAAHAERIEPMLPISVAGLMSDQVAHRIHDPLHVRALVLRQAGVSVAFVVCDSCMIERAILDEAKVRIEEETSIAPSHVMIAATHSHSCPASARVFRTMPDERYQEELIERIVTAVATAQLRLEPVVVGYGEGECAEEVFHRRWKMKPTASLVDPWGNPEKVQMNPPLGSSDLLEPAGPVDPAVGVLWVKAMDGEPIGAMANYALHYVGGVPTGEISADYFGEFARRLGDLWKPTSARRRPVVMMTNGASGDINNINFSAAGSPAEPFTRMSRVAGRVAERARQAIDASVQASPGGEPAVLASVRQEVRLGVRKPSAAERAQAAQMVALVEGRPLRSLPEIYAAETLDLSTYPDQVSLWIQVARVGEVAIVSLPCEVFVEIGLEIKKRSPFPQTVVVELANGYNGYLPTPAQHALGGYETWRAKSSYLEVNASEVIVQTVLDLLDSLRKSGPGPS